MKKINILVIGSGGREHSLAWKISKSPKLKELYCIPGNPGMEEIAECVDIDTNDIEALIRFAVSNEIGLTVVGPEDPLVDGIVDRFQDANLNIFGPNKKAAILEGSKAYSKNLMRKHGIPTGDFKIFQDCEPALDYLNLIEGPVVIKADGLAKGKGVFVCKNKDEAIKAVNQIMKDRVFGSAGEKIVIEEFLEGREVSVLAFTDSKTILAMEMAQDHKAAYDGGKGPNTGGMGAFSPAPTLNNRIYTEIEKHVLVPTVHAMNREGRPYKGLLYAGLMINTHEAKVRVLEYNVRFGDPETQALMVRMESDIVPILLATINGTLDQIELIWDQRPSVCVVLASEGYPAKYETGLEISGLDNLQTLKDTEVFHAGTKKINGKLLTNGGRVLNVTASGSDINEAQKKAYEAAEQIHFDGVHFRKDIASNLQK